MIKNRNGQRVTYTAPVAREPAHVCWDVIEQDYLAGRETIRSIAKKHGVSESCIYRKARGNAWPKRKPNRQSVPLSVSAPKTLKASSKEALIKRFYTVLDQQTCELEQRFSEHAGSLPPSSEAERDARTLSSLTKLLEKLIELEQSSVADDQTPVGDDPAQADMDAFRCELAAKLEALQQRDPD